MIGYIKIDRKILNWEWYQDIKVFHLFLYCLLKANHKDSKWHGKEIKRGQLVTGRLKLNKDTGLTEREVRTCLTKLKTTGEIAIITTSKYSIITICKYDYYQKKYNEDDQEEDQQNDQEKTNKRPTKGQQTTTNNNDNNINNDKHLRKQESNAPDFLKNSNLFKQPNIPAFEEVLRVFFQNGGSEEMAQTFFKKNESTGWFYKGSPITNFASLIPSYVDSWKKNEKNGFNGTKGGTSTKGGGVAGTDTIESDREYKGLRSRT